jgi:hypothetical protein
MNNASAYIDSEQTGKIHQTGSSCGSKERVIFEIIRHGKKNQTTTSVSALHVLREMKPSLPEIKPKELIAKICKIPMAIAWKFENSTYMI